MVEDQAEVRKYAAAALKAYGYQVIQAENAEEALLVCERESERIDLVLTDVVMPGLSGRELADRLKNTPAGNQSAVHVGLHRRHHGASWGPAEGSGVHPEAV